MRGRAAELQRGLRGNRFNVGDAADPVGAENLRRLFHRLTETRSGRFVNGKVRQFIPLFDARGRDRLGKCIRCPIQAKRCSISAGIFPGLECVG